MSLQCGHIPDALQKQQELMKRLGTNVKPAPTARQPTKAHDQASEG
jgi:hypothetical protein